MTRVLLKSPAFIRSAKRLVKKSPGLAKDIQATLERLAEDAFQPLLKTHKLKGELKDSWACRVDYELRIVFELVPYQDTEAVLLEDIGTHDKVY